MELDKTMTILILIELVLSFCAGWFLNQSFHEPEVVREIQTETITQINNVPVYVNVTKYITVKPTYETLLNEAHSVKNQYWKCLNYSEFLLTNLRASGYNATMVCGWKLNKTTGNYDDGHAWIQLLLFLDPTDNLILQQPYKYDTYDFDCEKKYFG